MAYRFTRQRIRVKVDVNLKTGQGAITDAISGDVPKFARGAALQIEVGLFFADTILDASNISAATCVIKSGTDPDDSVAMTKTIGPTGMNRGLTLEDWDTGEADKAHLIFLFTAAETADGVFGTPEDTAQHWIVLSGLTDDDGTDTDVFGFGSSIKSFDAGLTTLGAPPAGQTAASMEQITAALQDFVKKVGSPGDTITLVSGATRRQVKLAATDDGQLSTGTQPTD